MKLRQLETQFFVTTSRVNLTLKTYIQTGFDPYINLALERYLLESVAPGEVILYLWQNQNTVVIGRNQSAMAECRVATLKEDGGKLARRLSGGGAVFHDLGNYNFTFLMPTEMFDEKKQTDVILRAVQKLGLPATKTGRNDLLVEGAKFSGHAYYHTKTSSYHHGTLLVDVDKEKMQKYLNPAPLKLKAKGVASVKSRVCNLRDFAPELNINDIPGMLIAAFEEIYGEASTPIELSPNAENKIKQFANEFASDEWLFKGEEALDHSSEEKFDWGLARLDWNEEGGKFAKVAFYTDGLEPDLFVNAADTLCGLAIERGPIEAALLKHMNEVSGESSAHAQYAADIASLIRERN